MVRQRAAAVSCHVDRGQPTGLKATRGDDTENAEHDGSECEPEVFRKKTPILGGRLPECCPDDDEHASDDGQQREDEVDAGHDRGTPEVDERFRVEGIAVIVRPRFDLPPSQGQRTQHEDGGRLREGPASRSFEGQRHHEVAVRSRGEQALRGERADDRRHHENDEDRQKSDGHEFGQVPPGARGLTLRVIGLVELTHRREAICARPIGT
jgi:hypothetical protein